MPAHRNIWQRFLTWRIQHKNNRLFFLACSMLIGIVVGFIALGLKSAVFELKAWFTESRETSHTHLIYLVLPAAGVLAAMLLKKWVIKDKVKHNVSSVLGAISKRNSIMKAHKIVSSVLGGVFTAGLGGSVGLESPVISSGGSFGSNLGRLLRMDYKQVTLLLACGSAAGISAIFNTPIAGIVFAIEVLMIDLTRYSLIPLLIASMSGTIITYIFYGEGVLFQYSISDAFIPEYIPYYIVLALVTALVSLYFTKVYLWIEHRFDKLKSTWYKWLIGSTLLGGLLFVFPQLWGEGYFNISQLLNHDLNGLLGNTFYQAAAKDYVGVFILIMVMLILLKGIATSITISAGGIGGIFAPSAFTGAFTGYTFAFVVNMIAGTRLIPPAHFALVGMAGALSGVLHAPLTGLFLIAEITKGYHLIIPLMICVTITFVIVKALEPNSVFTMQLARKGQLITHNKDKAVLTFMKLENVIEREFVTVPVDASLGELVKYIAKSKRDIFPVVGQNNKLEGIIHIQDIREIMFDKSHYDNTWVRNLMRIPPAVIQMHDSMQQVMRKFKKTDAWNLPVVDGDKYEGIISKSSLFSVYRKQLMEITED